MLTAKNRSEASKTGVYQGETTFTTYEGVLKKGDRRVWQLDKKVVYFSCPRCSRILKLDVDEVDKFYGGTCTVTSDGSIYQSVWCGTKRNPDHHLWVELKGFFNRESR